MTSGVSQGPILRQVLFNVLPSMIHMSYRQWVECTFSKLADDTKPTAAVHMPVGMGCLPEGHGQA